MSELSRVEVIPNILGVKAEISMTTSAGMLAHRAAARIAWRWGPHTGNASFAYRR